MVKQQFFEYIDLVHHPTETTIKKWMFIGYQEDMFFFNQATIQVLSPWTQLPSNACRATKKLQARSVSEAPSDVVKWGCWRVEVQVIPRNFLRGKSPSFQDFLPQKDVPKEIKSETFPKEK